MPLVQDLLTSACQVSPNKIALVSGGEALTYSELDTKAHLLAGFLTEQGTAKGERIALLLPNGIDFAIAFFAVLRANAIVVPLNYRSNSSSISKIVADCTPSIIITDKTKLKQFTVEPIGQDRLRKLIVFANEAQTSIGNIEYVNWDEKKVMGKWVTTKCEVIDQDLAYLIYTSGSTGEPMGVMGAHSNILFAIESITKYLGCVADDIILCSLPFSFDYGLYQLLISVASVGKLIIENSFLYPENTLQMILDWKVTGFPVVPMMLAKILELYSDEHDLSSLRYITSTGARLPIDQIRQLKSTFPNVKVFSMYGLTETKRTLYLPPEHLDLRPESVGIPIPGTQVWIEDDTGTSMGPNQVGELVVRGRHVMRGYWNKSEQSAKKFRPGPYPGECVCYTGDLFRMDDEGYFYFVARKDEIINSRGIKIAPQRIEDVLNLLPGVTSVAVIGIPDDLLGQAIKAFIACSTQTLSEDTIRRHCMNMLESYMVPQSIKIMASLPLNNNGKVDKVRLLDYLE